MKFLKFLASPVTMAVTLLIGTAGGLACQIIQTRDNIKHRESNHQQIGIGIAMGQEAIKESKKAKKASTKKEI